MITGVVVVVVLVVVLVWYDGVVVAHNRTLLAGL